MSSCLAQEPCLSHSCSQKCTASLLLSISYQYSSNSSTIGSKAEILKDTLEQKFGPSVPVSVGLKTYENELYEHFYKNQKTLQTIGIECWCFLLFKHNLLAKHEKIVPDSMNGPNGWEPLESTFSTFFAILKLLASWVSPFLCEFQFIPIPFILRSAVQYCITFWIHANITLKLLRFYYIQHRIKHAIQQKKQWKISFQFLKNSFGA